MTRTTGQPVVEVDALRKSYGGRAVVDGVSFAVEEGEIFGILGPNGAGKTTTVECVEGLRVPDAGRVRVTGLDPVADHEQVSRVLGAQLQQSELQPKLTVREALELYATFYPHPADWRRLPSGLRRPLPGPRQRAPLRPRTAVLALVAKGTSNREIARELFISEATVKTHLSHLYAKLGVNDRAAAVAVAYDRGILG